MRIVQCLCLLAVAFFYSGCVCLFTPCDRRLHVSGHVLDAQHKPIGYATVEFHGVKKETDENGCFYFNEVPAGSELNVAVSKIGYKPYREAKEFDFYEIVVTLVSDNVEQRSSAVWHKLQVDELPRYKDCSGK